MIFDVSRNVINVDIAVLSCRKVLNWKLLATQQQWKFVFKISFNFLAYVRKEMAIMGMLFHRCYLVTSDGNSDWNKCPRVSWSNIQQQKFHRKMVTWRKGFGWLITLIVVIYLILTMNPGAIPKDWVFFKEIFYTGTVIIIFVLLRWKCSSSKTI